MRNAVAAVALLATLVAPAPAAAWGFEAHKFITRRAIELLPPELAPFFAAHRDEVVMRATDPDLWRNAGWDEDPNHFVDFGVREYGDYPFAALPRDLDAAIQKFGVATVRKNGMLPWRASEMFGNLRRAFERLGRGQFVANDLIMFASATGHYLQDATQPFHATNNYDGELTGNDGIHNRFEATLFERFESKLVIAPAPPSPMRNPRDASFEFLASGYRLVDSILNADREAVAGKDVYDDDYFAKLFERVRPILERRLADAVTATASAIVGAWDAAGRPAVALERSPRPPQAVKKPRL